jgi:zinc transport system substrate-binding protein
VSTSIAPIKTFIEKIAGTDVKVHQIIPNGANPTTYDPGSKSMRYIAQSSLYFAIDVPFEKVWLYRFSAQNSNLKIIKLWENVTRHEIDEAEEEHDHDSHNHEGHHHASGSLDPHIWLSPSYVKQISLDIKNTLCKVDKLHCASYTENYQHFLQEIQNTDTKVKELLSDVKKGSAMMVYHPSWGYFAREYGLKQVAVELNGKSPKLSHLKAFIQRVKSKNIKIVFVQKEFSQKSAQLIANSSGAKVVAISPLSQYWSKNMIDTATFIQKSYE